MSFAQSTAGAGGGPPAVERSAEEAAACEALSLSCRRISVMVCLATNRCALDEMVPCTLSNADTELQRCFTSLEGIRTAEKALSLIPRFKAMHSDDSANAAFELSLRGQLQEMARLWSQRDDSLLLVRRVDDVRRREAALHTCSLALVLAAHRTSRATMHALCRKGSMLLAASRTQLTLLDGTMRMYRNVLSRANAMGLAPEEAS